MTMSYILSFFQEAIILAAMLSLPPLILGLIVGLVIAVFQAVTQINEQTLVIVPKMIAIIGALLVFGNWMLSQLVDYTLKIFNSIPDIPG
jgi:flagellar biosynthesis protein FliQ